MLEMFVVQEAQEDTEMMLDTSIRIHNLLEAKYFVLFLTHPAVLWIGVVSPHHHINYNIFLFMAVLWPQFHYICGDNAKYSVAGRFSNCEILQWRRP